MEKLIKALEKNIPEPILFTDKASKERPYSTKFSIPLSAAILIIVYVIVITAGFEFARIFSTYIHDKILNMLAVDMAMTSVIFIFSFILQNSSVYDPFWFTGTWIMCLWWFLDSRNYNISGILGIFAITFYALRHGILFFRQWSGLAYEDFRFRHTQNVLRNHPVLYWIFSYIAFHVLTSVFSFSGMVPLGYVFYSKAVQNQLLLWIGFIVAFGGILLELIADEQLYQFRKRKMEGCIEIGLWRYSRHPNYLGETIFWLGLYIMAIGSNTTNWWTIFGPIVLWILLYGTTGLWMELYLKQRKPAYADYQKRVSYFMIWFRNENKKKD